LGGISILGTTGIVKPLSHEAYVATIAAVMSVARASGLHRLVLATGRRSERYAQAIFTDLPDLAFVQIGDYFKTALETASAKGFNELVLAVFFGKALKMAQAVPHTHAAASRLSLRALAAWTLALTGDKALAAAIAGANTARQAFEMLMPRYPQVVAEVGRRIVHSAATFAGGGVQVQSVLFDYQGAVAFRSHGDGGPVLP
jgi:cobalt-precorrin-5B (C1)-methyltransferase